MGAQHNRFFWGDSMKPEIFTNFNQSAKLISIFSLTLLLAACEDGDLPKLQGRYQGVQVTRTQKIQVITQVPEFASVGKAKVSIFKIYPTLAMATGDQYSILILDKKTLELKAPQLPPAGVRLSLDKNCATGSNGSQEVSTCWADGKLDFVLTDNSDPEKSVTINLIKDDTLPPIDKNRFYSLDELTGRAKYINYSVSQEAERVFQAKLNIGVARGNLLPRLNLKSLVGIFTGDYLSAVGTVLPFLFPSNWFNWKISKELYQAQRNSFASLRGNEMNSVEGLFYLILRDQIVLERLKKHIAWMKQTQEGLRREEAVGTVPEGAADYFGTSIALMERDRINFETLVRIQYGQLAQGTALPPIEGIAGLVPVVFPPLDNEKPIDPADFYKDAQDKSYEVKSLNFLLQAAKYAKQEIYFSFFDMEGNNGIGFGTPYQIRVAKSQQNEIKKKTDETLSLIELKSSLVTTEYNQALESYRVATSSLRSTEKRLKWIIDRHLQGDGKMDENEFVDQLIDLQYKIISFAADQATSIQVWLMAKSKVNRLLLAGYYSDLEAALPDEPREQQKDEGGNSSNSNQMN